MKPSRGKHWNYVCLVGISIPLCCCAGEVLEEKHFMCQQPSTAFQSVSSWDAPRTWCGWNCCQRHLEKPTGKAASAEVTPVSVLPHNTGRVLCQLYWELLGENICVTTFLPFSSSGERRASLQAASFSSSIIFSTTFLYFATVNWSSGCCKNFCRLKNSNWDVYVVAKLILPALTWRGMLSTITCGRVMTVVTTGTLSTGELLQEKVKYRPCWILYYIKYQVSIQTK